MAGDTVRINLKTLFFSLIAFIVIVIFSIGAITNGDPLWFLPIFNATPARITIYREGCVRTLSPGQPEFDNLTQVINQSLTQVEGFSNSFGLSSDSLKDYRDQQRAVEIYYTEDVTIHTGYRFGHPDSLFIPLDSYFGETRSVFGGHKGDYWAGALRLKSNDTLQRAVESVPCPP